MPNVTLSKQDLDDLIDALLFMRVAGEPEFDLAMRLSDIHLRLENELEAWTNGGEIEIPLSPALKAAGAKQMFKVYEAHPDD
jgi:hypothetical protein